MINPRAVAVEGVGFGPIPVSTQGFIVGALVVVVTPELGFVLAWVDDAGVVSNVLQGVVFSPPLGGFHQPASELPAEAQHSPTGLNPQVDPDRLVLPAVGSFHVAADPVPALPQHTPTGLNPQVDPDLLPGPQESSSNVAPSSAVVTPPHEPTGLDPQVDPPRLFRLPD